MAPSSKESSAGRAALKLMRQGVRRKGRAVIAGLGSSVGIDTRKCGCGLLRGVGRARERRGGVRASAVSVLTGVALLGLVGIGNSGPRMDGFRRAFMGRFGVQRAFFAFAARATSSSSSEIESRRGAIAE